MEVLVEHLGAVQFQVTARQHTVICDQPPENGGHDEGMTPPEFLLASLGACAGFYAAAYLKKHKLAAEGTLVRVTAEKQKNPARLDNFQIRIDLPVELSEEHRKGVEESVHHCLIHNTLRTLPLVELQVNTAVAAH